MRALLVGLVFAVGVAACGSPSSSSPAAIQPTSSGSPEVAGVAPTPEPTSAAAATATPRPTANSKPIATRRPTPACLARSLAAKVTSWVGAMGHQIASVTLTNTSSSPCIVQGTPAVELLGHDRAVLIDSRTEGASGLPHVTSGDPRIRLRTGASLHTQVDTDNYCGAAPALPTTVAFILPSGHARLVAAPGPGGDVPPCLGKRSPGTIAMNGWVR